MPLSYRSKYRRSFIGFIKIPTLSCFLYSNTDTLLFFFIKLLTLFCLFYQNTDSLLSFFIKIPTIFCLFYQNTDALLPFLSKPTFFYFLVYVTVDKILLLTLFFCSKQGNKCLEVLHTTIVVNEKELGWLEELEIKYSQFPKLSRSAFVTVESNIITIYEYNQSQTKKNTFYTKKGKFLEQKFFLQDYDNCNK